MLYISYVVRAILDIGDIRVCSTRNVPLIVFLPFSFVDVQSRTTFRPFLFFVYALFPRHRCCCTIPKKSVRVARAAYSVRTEKNRYTVSDKTRSNSDARICCVTASSIGLFRV